MPSTLFRGLVRSGWFLLLCFPFSTVFAGVIANSALTISNLQIIPSVGSVMFSGPRDTSAIVSSAFNSLGENVSDGDFGTGTDVSADATVNFATGHAEASDSAGTLNVSSGINMGGNNNAAGVAFPGSLASLSGWFDLVGAIGMLDVTFSMDVSGMLSGFTDDLGDFETDFIASLDLDGENVLFLDVALVGGPNFSDVIPQFSQSLYATISLDSDVTHFFNLTAQSEGKGSNMPEPGTMVLSLLALALLYKTNSKRGRPPA